MSKQDNPYATIQVHREIKEQIVEFCNKKGLKIGQYIERLFQQNMSSSFSGSIGP